MIKIRVNLNEVLKNKGMSIYELQKLTGISYPTLHNIAKENSNTSSIKFDILAKIIEATGCELTDILVIEKE